MENQNITTGLIIKGYRENYGYTQDKLADFLGIKRELVSFYETGEREAPIEVLEKLSDLFNIELDVFFVEHVDEAKAEIAFAFRKDELDVNDMNEVAHFGKIVKNYLKIVSLDERGK